jgi:NADH dehydrogenase FAD-containing subunit
LTLVDRHTFHLFQPVTYQVATGAISPGKVAEIDRQADPSADPEHRLPSNCD